MKIVYIPLDERPCNTIYPIETAESAQNVEVLSPSPEILGKKKRAGDVRKIREFLLEKVKEADAIVLSTEMLVYGGLVPSRLHHLDDEAIEEYHSVISQLKEEDPDVKVYVSNLIMRTPRYSSDDEEPDYYGIYGEQIFNYGWLKDKHLRNNLDRDEEESLGELEESIPEEIIKDYETRRAFNVRVNKLNIKLLDEGKIDFLVIPQDDAAEYGYTALDQQQVFKELNARKLQNVMIYPGADEVGFTLLARAYQEFNHLKIKVYPFYSSTFGKEIIPNYEDRPIHETMKAHVMASGCELVYSSDEADMILAYNTPGKVMQEAWDQFTEQDVTYSTYRHLPTFINGIKNFIEKDYPVVIADSAYSNGGDSELIQLLNDYQLFDKLASYKGWNTNGNTLGSTLSAGVFSYKNKDSKKVLQNLMLHFYEDFIYQSIVRMEVTNHQLPALDLNYFDLKDKKEEVANIVKEKMLNQAKDYLTSTSALENYDIEIDFPWNRMFEVSVELVDKSFTTT